ncbi:HD domain-containing protein [Spirochaetia bacterium 38H-sp]|uniref:HD domain-containing protein n=1 Tax=Rarispira pelagica TaxID=3141764 RepID=A0ABU9U914_9SPIR
MDRQEILKLLKKNRYNPRLMGFSALDRYYRFYDDQYYLLIKSSADMVALAQMFDNLIFPSMFAIEAAIVEEDSVVLFSEEGMFSYLPELNITADPFSRRFYMSDSAIKSIRSKKLECAGEYSIRDVLNIAIMISRYDFSIEGDFFPDMKSYMPSQDEQRIFLSLLMSSYKPWKGLSLLDKSGLLSVLWPELARMKDVEHSKDYHPEGSVWQHTLEALRYPKKRLLPVTLAVLLHDAGKPLATEQDGKRFFAHANIGESIARSFLKRLGFSSSLTEDVAFLVRHHMLPHALPSLRPSSVSNVLDSPLFPMLLEVYRCDLFSTFKGPDSYHRSCKAYKAYLKNRKNPYKNMDFKKDVKLFVE